MFDGFTLVSIGILAIAGVTVGKIAIDSRRHVKRKHVHHLGGPGISRTRALEIAEIEHGPLTSSFQR